MQVASVGDIYRGVLAHSERVQREAEERTEAFCLDGPIPDRWCDDIARRAGDAVDRAYDFAFDPRNETKTYVGAHVLWKLTQAEEFIRPRG